MRIIIKEIQSTRGILAYRCNQNSSTPALMFVHGLGGDSKLFHNQLRFFGQKYHVMAVDLPGHGKSTWNSLPAVEDYAASIGDVLNNESVTDCILIGHSMGGAVCFDIYPEIKNSIRALVLISTGAVLPVAKELFEMLERDVDFFIDYFVNATFSQNAGLLASFAKPSFGQREKEIVRNDLKICQEMDYSQVLKEIDVPVLIIANKGDRVVPTHITSFLQNRIKNSQYVEFNLEGHIPHFDHKEIFNNALKEFLVRVCPEQVVLQ
ncbi:MAG TPA: alpha/beta hydrolase [Spirochaetota bacterium]|nr:alpha/beta hydrolase [Spirochaetota bacterium]HPI88160.1 alpha/beta hydrolase [Spirochaetota bacterium]HPR47935.1 alpha/beta hydrolase [Spirochaetota bacterium]